MKYLEGYQRAKLATLANDLERAEKELRDTVERYYSEGYRPTEIGRYSRVPRSTLYRWLGLTKRPGDTVTKP